MTPGMDTTQIITLEDVRRVHALPFSDLIFRAQTVHRRFHDPGRVQLSTLLSIKTGRCPEDCKYCPQSSHYETSLQIEPLMKAEDIVARAAQAKSAGAERFCMGAAWRQVPDGAQFDTILSAVRGVAELGGLEVCCTLGMMRPDQAEKLRAAGCDYYNHNLDTSRQHYANIITTRRYEDRLATLQTARRAGLKLCCGGIVGMGEALEDRLGLLFELAQLDPPPESIPINAYVPVEGVPLAKSAPIDPLDFVRMIATARILFPRSEVRLSAGRTSMTEELQALCFLAGANSIFFGEKLLTTPNPEASEDQMLLKKLGINK
jgi:biotin synthase